jgi:hypothetical protein
MPAVDVVAPTPTAESPKVATAVPASSTASGHTIARRIVSMVSIVMIAYYFLGTAAKEAFQYHPIMMAIAFVGLMPETIYAVKAVKRSRTLVDRNAAIADHMNMAYGLKLFSIAGLIAIIIVKQQYGKSHFTSLHGQVGVLTVFLVVAQVILGYVYHNRSCGGGTIQGRLRKAHYYLGVAVLIGGILSMGLGMMSHTGQRLVVNPLTHVFLTGVTALVSVWAYLK